jgi:uncharacterized protein YecT (DUF1311 family)
LNQAEYERYQRWQKALNEIVAQLKKDLPAEQWSRLQQEQLEWVKTRESKAIAAGKEMEGGSAEPMLRNGTAADLTEKRCYELVEMYM